MGRNPNYEIESLTVRLPLAASAWFQKEAEGERSSKSEFIRQVLVGFANCFGMPTVHAELLDHDRRELGFTWRGYVLHLLARRLDEVKDRGPAFDRAPRYGPPKLALAEPASTPS